MSLPSALCEDDFHCIKIIANTTRKQFEWRKFCVTQGTCLYNGTFSLLLTYLHPKPCYPLRWLMLCGYNQHHHRQRGHPSCAGCSVTVGFSFTRLISNPHAHTEKLWLMSKSSQLESPLVGTLCNTFHCTEQVPFQSRSICRQARNGCEGRGHYFFPCPIKTRGSQRYKNNRLAGLGHILTVCCSDHTDKVIIDG